MRDSLSSFLAHCSRKERPPSACQLCHPTQPAVDCATPRDSPSFTSDDGVPRHTIHLNSSVHTPPGPADSVASAPNWDYPIWDTPYCAYSIAVREWPLGTATKFSLSLRDACKRVSKK
eukprot:scaffold5264_cov98-Alexandrium_tamarense.AAC.3